MKLVIQRVKNAKVSTDEGVVGEIGHGLFVLLGVAHEDTEEVAEKMAQKLYKMRLMKDADGKMNNSVADAGGEFLVVSQFTLYGDTSGGNRPSFVRAARPEVAEPLYDHFCKKLEELGAQVARGRFGNYMNIEASLDGPVTILVASD